MVGSENMVGTENMVGRAPLVGTEPLVVSAQQSDSGQGIRSQRLDHSGRLPRGQDCPTDRHPAMAWNRIRRGLIRSMAALGLVLCLFLTACSGGNARLSGNYVDDTVNVAQSLLTTIAVDHDDPGRQQSEIEARALINDYMSRYRPQSRVNGLASFTTMQTALNSLAAHYAGYANRPIPEALRARLEKELTKAERTVVRGS